MASLTLTASVEDFEGTPVAVTLTVTADRALVVDGETVRVRPRRERTGTDGRLSLDLVALPDLGYWVEGPWTQLGARLRVWFPSEPYAGQTVTLADIITNHPGPPTPTPPADKWATLVGRVTTTELRVIDLDTLTAALEAGRVRVLTNDPSLTTPEHDTDPHRQDVYVDPGTGRRFWTVRDVPTQAAVELRDAAWTWASAPLAAVPTAITTQPTPDGRTIRPILAGGRVWLGYGDWTVNTGPIDLYDADPMNLAAAPVQRFAAYSTEAIEHVEEGHTGTLWVPNIDSTHGGANDLLTDEGGTWHTITAPAMDHMLDAADTLHGLFLAGSEGNNVTPSRAVVYRSTDHGVTWARVFAATDIGMGEWARVYGFHVIDGRVFIGGLASVVVPEWMDRYWEWDGTQFVDSPLPVTNARAREIGRMTVDGRTLIAMSTGAAYWLDGSTLVPAGGAPPAWPSVTWDEDAWITWSGSTVQRKAVTGRDGDLLTTTTTALHTVTGTIAAVAAWRDTHGVLHTLTTLQGGGWAHHEYAPPAWMRAGTPAFDAGMHQTAPGVYEVTSPAPFPLDPVHGFAPDGTPSAGAAAALAGKADTSALTAHTSATTGVHGIADTADLIIEGDPRLTNPRPPTAHTHLVAQISDSTTVGQSVLTAASAQAARGVVGAFPTYSGVGDPNGNVSGTTGDTYVDTSAIPGVFPGARNWIKTTSSGANGWVVTLGDTGLIYAPAYAGFTCDIRIRRRNSLVSLDLAGTHPASYSGSSYIPGTLPVWARPASTQRVQLSESGTALSRMIAIPSTGAIYITLNPSVSAPYQSQTMTYPVYSAWPVQP